MRPVDRGEPPTDANQSPVEFTDHKQAREPLIRRIGAYCSYCEMPVKSSPDVEHVLPKSVPANQGLALAWPNFLLACKSCNDTKGHTDVRLEDYYWPDTDNTSRAFSYADGLPPEPATNLTPDQRAVAERTLFLTGLDRGPDHPDLSLRDRRWKEREAAWRLARYWRGRLASDDTDVLRDAVEEIARQNGFWSVWMAVFGADQDMRRRLIRAFPGTATDCFDTKTQPVPRPGGRL